ncbi:MAG: ImmA/IrrE family metallo-endopeptidase [Muribaculaceae bacterium]|nr:ImmA/IrrE family metallo-endopeptidase [Muribaculaceae bacterium]
MTTTQFNKERLDYLLALFSMSKNDLLAILNQDRKKALSLSDIYSDEIKLSLLKKIDEIFHKGLSFYLDFTPVDGNHNTKVFFRKSSFQTILSMEDKRLVDSFESLKCLLDGYRTLTDTLTCQYQLHSSFSIEQDPKKVADQVRNTLMPQKHIKDHREFLKALIAKLADINVYVFEFVETWNKREKATIDGFYIDPNVIVLKRQSSYKREIFTLAHEIGHYLLGVEDVDALDMSKVEKSRIYNKVERWCSDFAFYLIAGEAVNQLDKFTYYSEDVNIAIDELSKSTHISRMAWYTRLAYNKIVPLRRHKGIIRELEEEQAEKLKAKKEKLQLKSSHARNPKPIVSPLYLETMQYAFYNGLVSEASFCEQLKISPSQIEKFL